MFGTTTEIFFSFRKFVFCRKYLRFLENSDFFNQMPVKWMEDRTNSFWVTRQWNVVGMNGNLAEKVSTFETSQSSRKIESYVLSQIFLKKFQNCI